MNSAFVLSNEPAAIDTTGFPQVIRRDLPGDPSGKPRVVPWLGHKIAKAVAAACHAVGQDEILGQQVQAEIEYRVKRERPSFVHIEQIQDMVEEALIELDQAKVALAYGKYRARRAVQREHEASEIGGSGEQLELATHAQLADMRGRISFAKIGLRLTMDDNDLLARLLRSTSLGLTLDERRATIILSAKSLLDSDADARFFAARILLSYIYL
jgi:ribonucleoside-diphosphate reductase alpha chain